MTETTLVRCRDYRAAESLTAALRIEAPDHLTSAVSDTEVLTTASTRLVWAVIFRRLK